MGEFLSGVVMTMASAPGTGTTISLSGAAVIGGVTFMTLAQAGAIASHVYDYSLLDKTNGGYEQGYVTMPASGLVMTNRTVTYSTNGNAPINASIDTLFYSSGRPASFNDASVIKTGLMDVNRLGTGAVGAGAKSLFDDNTWKTLAAIAQSGSASDLASGTVPTARLGSGTASGSTFLRGDQTWAAIVSTGRLIGFNVYTSSQTVTIPAGATACFLRMCGGCGGGGTLSTGGAGGGALEKYLTGLTAGNTFSFTSGASGGSSSAGGNSILASGTQSITTLTANGGSLSAKGGTATNGDVNVQGQSSITGTSWGAGGSTGFGMGYGATNSNNGLEVSATAGYLEIWWFS